MIINALCCLAALAVPYPQLKLAEAHRFESLSAYPQHHLAGPTFP
ncbi:hypothetical protein [Mesorhizobium sp. RIZ17]